MGDSLFHIDIVRDFILSRGGRVKNHELVTHFKRFLNDPSCKASNREKFKDFVNTLATVKLDENGEKVLVLKKRFRDGGPAAATPSRGHDIKERGPRHELQRPKAKIRKNFEGAPAEPFTPSRPADLPAAAAVAPLPPPEEMSQEATLPEDGIGADSPMEEQHQMSSLSLEESQMDDIDENKENMPVVPDDAPQSGINLGDAVGESSTDRAAVSTSLTLAGASMDESHTDEPAAPAEPMQLGTPVGESSTDSPPPSSGQGEDGSFSTPVSTRVSGLVAEEGDAGKPNTPMSVKDRARHLNRMTSETDVQSPVTHHQPRSHKTELRRNKAVNSEDDSNSVSSVGIAMDQTEREWMITCASAEYHPMHKLLQKNPTLAKKKDFISTALHWAAKHGNADVIKLLCGTGHANINAHSGYTPLHLASIQGHEEIIQLLVQGYGADANIRDFSGKKPKQYLRNAASSSTQQLLASRRPLNSAQNQNFKRQGSYSSKIQKTGFFGISSSSAVRNSWTNPNDQGSDKERSSRSPSLSPRTSPSSGRKLWSTKKGRSTPSPRPSPQASPRTSPRLFRRSKPKDFLVPLSPRWARRGSANDVSIRSFLSPFSLSGVSRPPRRTSVQDEMMMPPPKGLPSKRKKKKGDEELTHARINPRKWLYYKGQIYQQKEKRARGELIEAE